MNKTLLHCDRNIAGTEDILQCQQCLKCFSSHIKLTKHIENHSKEKTFKCTYCGRCFKQQSHLQQHIRLHTGERPYRCHLPNCGRAFIQLSNLQQHLKNHDSQLERAKHRPFECETCGKGFVSESSLLAHRSKQHAVLIGNEYQACPMCFRLCMGPEALAQHLQSTHNKVQPNSMPRSQPVNFAGKIQPHTIIKKEKVSQSSGLSLYSSSNMPIRMWPCTACHCVYAQEVGLLNHLENFKMDPKHALAAQHVLSRVAAEKCQKEIASAVALSIIGENNFGFPLDHRSGNNESHHASLTSLQPVPPTSTILPITSSVPVTSSLPPPPAHMSTESQGPQQYQLMSAVKKD